MADRWRHAAVSKTGNGLTFSYRPVGAHAGRVISESSLPRLGALPSQCVENDLDRGQLGAAPSGAYHFPLRMARRSPRSLPRRKEDGWLIACAAGTVIPATSPTRTRDALPASDAHQPGRGRRAPGRTFSGNDKHHPAYRLCSRTAGCEKSGHDGERPARPMTGSAFYSRQPIRRGRRVARAQLARSDLRPRACS